MTEIPNRARVRMTHPDGYEIIAKRVCATFMGPCTPFLEFAPMVTVLEHQLTNKGWSKPVEVPRETREP